MEADEVFEEFLALRRELMENYPGEMNEFFADESNLSDFQRNPTSYFPQASFLPAGNYEQLAHPAPSFNEPTISSQSAIGCSLESVYPFKDGLLSTPDLAFSSSETPTLFPLVEDDELGLLCKNLYAVDSKEGISKQGISQPLGLPEFELSAAEAGSRSKQLAKRRMSGQPSKNLMAERRRRKRLNDRLSMLRSVVPRISKMDRTSILGDTIDYTKELLARIKSLQEEVDISEDCNNHLNLLSFFKQVEQNQSLVRNTPRFDVERSVDTRLDVCCAAKPGLLLSTISTIEALGLEIQQCVISCFNDFGMQASCREDGEQRSRLRSEDIKQALLRNAGYGGRCN